jgi:hypothetical protein
VTNAQLGILLVEVVGNVCGALRGTYGVLLRCVACRAPKFKTALSFLTKVFSRIPFLFGLCLVCFALTNQFTCRGREPRVRAPIVKTPDYFPIAARMLICDITKNNAFVPNQLKW